MFLDNRAGIERHTYNQDEPGEEEEAWNQDYEVIEPFRPEEEFMVHDRVVVIQNLPKLKTSSEDFSRLNNYLTEEFRSYGHYDHNTFWVPTKEDDNGNKKTLGVCFVEFNDYQSAQDIIKDMNGFKLANFKGKDDKPPKLIVSDLSVFENLEEDEEFVPPTMEDVHRNIKTWWLMEDADHWQFRDQFVIRFQRDVRSELAHACVINWMDPLRDGAVPCYSGEKQEAEGKCMTSNRVAWSPQGAYLVTFHPKGLLFWAGSEWERKATFNHTYVDTIQFSPNEKFFVSYSSQIEMDRIEQAKKRGGGRRRKDEKRKKAEKEQKSVIVWDIERQKQARGFDAEWSHIHGGHIFKWSHDDKFFARMGSSKHTDETPAKWSDTPDGILWADKLTIFTTDAPKITKIKPDGENRKSLNVEGILDFMWHPADDILVWVTREIEREGCPDKPASIVVNRVSKNGVKELNFKRIYKVDNTSISMTWHPLGDFLAVKMFHYQKKVKRKGAEPNEPWEKKGLSHDMEVVCLNSTKYPVSGESLEAHATAVDWEPNDSGRFCVLVTTELMSCARFYQIEGEKITRLYDALDVKNCNHVNWSPAGRYLVISGFLDKDNNEVHNDDMKKCYHGGLYFYDADQKKLLKQDQHPSMTGLHWSPCGRFVITSVCVGYTEGNSESSDTGYKIWNFQGEQLFSKPHNQFHQFLWRPRPRSLLTREKIKQIRKKDYRQYRPVIMKEDSKITSSQLDEEARKRKELRSDWNELLGQWRDWAIEIRRAQQERHPGGVELDIKWVFKDETVEEVINFDKKEIKEEAIRNLQDKIGD